MLVGFWGLLAPPKIPTAVSQSPPGISGGFEDLGLGDSGPGLVNIFRHDSSKPAPHLVKSVWIVPLSD